jgi:hypothetical protein
MKKIIIFVTIMKEQILKILGNNRKWPVELLSATQPNQPYGLYTYRGEIYVFKEGQDISFDQLTSAEQTSVTSDILSGNYKTNKSLQ